LACLGGYLANKYVSIVPHYKATDKNNHISLVFGWRPSNK